jgi:hypothetical protein
MSPTNASLIIRSMTRAWDSGKESGKVHAKAWGQPDIGFESSIVGVVRAIADYADAYKARYHQSVCDDEALSENWQSLVYHCGELLTGDIGRLNRSVLDSLLDDFLKNEGCKSRVIRLKD